MARRRFFVDAVHGSHAVIEGEDAYHLARVLRAEPGERYEISDNHALYLAEIEAVRRDRISFRVVEQLPVSAPVLAVTLYAALFKFDRFEWLLEKATELGVSSIAPVIAERTEKGLDKAAAKRLARWRRIALEASQQARRARLPEVREAAPLEMAVRDAAGPRYLLDEAPGVPPMLPALAGNPESIALLVGPEGGWTDRERARASGAGWQAVSLGPQVLRAETAAIAALAICMARWTG
jgi:16S rRNA (uracil1498-N3)-methyltransferase